MVATAWLRYPGREGCLFMQAPAGCRHEGIIRGRQGKISEVRSCLVGLPAWPRRAKPIGYRRDCAVWKNEAASGIMDGEVQRMARNPSRDCDGMQPTLPLGL
jgi:hypothetical protein